MVDLIASHGRKDKSPKKAKAGHRNSNTTLDWDLSSSLAPEKPKGQRLTLKNSSFNKTGSFTRMREQYDMSKILRLATEQPELGRLLRERHVVLVVGSTHVNRIPRLLKEELLPTFFRQLQRGQLALSYISGPKVDGMEDTLLLASYLYKLQKSIVISEPSDSFFDSVRRTNLDTQGTAARAMTNADLSRTLTNVDRTQTKIERADTMTKPMIMRERAGTARSAFHRQLSKSLRDTLIMDDSKAQEKRQLEESFEQTFARLENADEATKDTILKPKRAVVDSKWTTSDSHVNRYYVNYGTMLDFFDYSGVRLQAAKRYCDLRRPTSYGFTIAPDVQAKAAYEKQLEQDSGARRKVAVQCNMFAVAQMGQPNMILPQTLDVLVRNYQ